MSEVLLVLNAGSSSIKFALFEAHSQPTADHLICEGAISGIGHRAHFKATGRSGETLIDEHLPDGESTDDAMAALIAWIERGFPDQTLAAAGHRVVHGGAVYDGPVRVEPGVIEELRSFDSLAPLHQPHNLAAIEALAKLHPDLPQVACFDTAFHHRQPEVATAFALPRELLEQGVRRYGFHGLNYQHVVEALPQVSGKPLPPRPLDGQAIAIDSPADRRETLATNASLVERVHNMLAVSGRRMMTPAEYRADVLGRA